MFKKNRKLKIALLVLAVALVLLAAAWVAFPEVVCHANWCRGPILP